MFDFGKQFSDLKDKIVRSITELFPRTGKLHTLKLKRVWVEDKLDPEDYASQKDARLRERTWSVPVYGDFELVNNASGKVIDHLERVRLAMVPKMTVRGSFIINGNEYQVSNMLRLKPGVYTVIQANGLLDSWVNLAHGKNFNVMLDPKTGVFTAKVGTANLKLFPLLVALGANRSEIEASWGKELTAQNAAKGDYDTEVLKAHKAFIGKPVADVATAIGDLTAYFGKTSIDPETTQKTLGKSFDKVTPALILEASRKILSVSRGQATTDDRDALEFKTAHSVEDLMPERIAKTSRSLAHSIDRNLDRKELIKHIVTVDAFGMPIDTFFTGSDEFSGLAQVTPQTNPLSMLGETTKTTTLGPGGISSVHSVTMESRAVNPTSFGFLDPIHTAEGERIGTTMHLASGTEKVGNNLVLKVLKPQTMELRALNATEASSATIAFRDEYTLKAGKLVPKRAKVRAVQGGKFLDASPDQVDYVFPSAKMFFDLSTNMVPFLQSNQGNRAMMASKMMEQALPLAHAEAPLVQTHLAAGRTFNHLVGEGFSAAAPVDGTVTKVSADEIKVRDGHGKVHTKSLPDRFPLNTHVYLQATPRVQVGQKVKAGDLLADTNYTRGGVLATGVNLTTAFVPYRGYNFEDGIAISESAAKKLSSMHMHPEAVEVDQGTVLNLKKFRAYYPNVLDVEAAKRLDDDGVIRVGQKVHHGDVIIAALHEEPMGPESEMLRKLHRAFIQPYRNAAVTWPQEDEGTVVDVVKQPKKVTVYITTEEPAKVADKLSNRVGAKGVITRILPDAEMPHTQAGRPVDVLLNPNGVIGRINLGQMLETAAGKIAEKTGKPYIADNFSGENYVAKIRQELKAHGLSDKEDLFDPRLNKTIPHVLVGKQYIMKLDHPVRKKFSARSTGGYTMDLQPPQGGGEGGQSISKMELASLLSHGVPHILQEAATIKSTRNDEFWRMLQAGQPLPAPVAPFSFQKLEAMIRGMGVDVTKDGHHLQLSPMTDGQILKMSNGEIKDALAVRAKDLRPEKDGIFDPAATGGIGGRHFNHVRLAEPTPNPVFEMAIRELLGLTEKDYRDYVDGRKWVSADGAPAERGAKGAVTGGAALKVLLGKINAAEEFAALKARAPALRGADLERANRKMRYLAALREKGLTPQVYVLENFPVIPPMFRPVYSLPNGNLGISQVNDLYRDAILVNNQLRDPKLPDDLKANLRRDLYNGLKGIVGLGTSLSGRQRKGFIEQIAGDSPKTGYFQSRIIGRRQDLTGRSAIIPGPELGLDQVAIPEPMAWKLYEPFVIRELGTMGYTPLQSKEHLEQKDDLARKALEVVMADRPVFLNRAPTLHKFGIMAFKPQMAPGKALKINPLIVQGFNADFDGDTMSVHVPITEEARREAHRMLPSANLFSPRDGSLMNLPSQEAVLGLYLATAGGKKTGAKFKTAAEAIKAYIAGKADLADEVSIAGKAMTIGQAAVNAVLPPEYRDPSMVVTKKKLAQLLNSLAKDKPQVFADVVSKLKDIGNEHAYRSGFSVGLDDLAVDAKARDKIFAEADRKAKKVGIAQAYSEATAKLEAHLKDTLTKSRNPFYQMVVSGARGNMSQLRQILGAPVLVRDTNDQVVPVPIKKSFAEGLSVADYLATMPGARKGIIDKSLMTSKPGAFSKELVSASMNQRVTMHDCGTLRGHELSVDDHDVLDRYLAKGVRGLAQRNDLVTPALLSRLRGKVKAITVRGPSTCEAPEGVCQLCYGLDEHGRKVELGRNVGVLAAQTITEPMTQMTLKTFHTGSVAEVGKASLSGGFARLKELLEMTETVRGKAALAEVDGQVNAVRQSPTGGHIVTIAGREHFVDPGRALTVKPGEQVKKGDRLSDGSIKPQELLELKGVPAVRNYLIDELKKEYSAQGIKVQSKIFEAAIRPLINTAQVIDPGASHHLPGDITTLSSIEKFNKSRPEAEQIQFEPKLKGVNTYPLMSHDWLHRLNYQRLAKTLTQGPAEGWKADILHSPIGAYATGTLLGHQKQAAAAEPDVPEGVALEDLEIPEIMEELKRA
ncbi:MAG: hypothetical protein ABFE07_28010 [Armatimonadia bacterium]